MSETTNSPPREESVGDMADRLTRQLKELVSEREMLRSERTTISERMKWLDGEIDKAERMTKALIPRHRNTASSKNVEVTS